ncbi:TonB-dependent receptor [Polymorphobacter sp.]|uniref:TonB-dependent receptor n=1 Tax=Polymorphobacter sp. TaxID=1909290 RepID=UPI003F6F76A9
MSAAVLAAPAAQAQTIGNETRSDSEIVVVTTRNRTEDIQDVPLAITAISAAEIERRSIQGLEDVARFTAGFSFETLDGGSGAPVIRGLTQVAAFNREQTTALFYDGIYLPRAFLFDPNTQNLERIEIAKGPQSSRFGRNAFAGAINFIPKKASLDATSGEVFATYGSYDRFDIGGNVNLVVVPDRVALFGSYFKTEFDGSWENTHPFANAGFDPGTNGRAGGFDNQAFSASALLRPVDRLMVSLSYFGSRISQEALPTDYRNLLNELGNFGPLGATGRPRLFRGSFPKPNDAVVVEPRGFGRQADMDTFRAELNLEISDGLQASYIFGKIKANSLTAFQSEPDPAVCGGVITPALYNNGAVTCNFQASPLGSLDYSSHEARLAYDNGGAWTVAIGGFALKGTDRNFFVSVNVPALSAQNLAPINITNVSTGPTGAFPFDPARFRNLVVRDEETTTDVVAGFAEASVAFNDGRSRLSVEGRYTSEKIETISVVTGIPVVPGGRTFNFFTPRVTLEHDLADTSLVYATVARGAKAGGFNSGALDKVQYGAFDPEFNWTYEIGSKNQFFDRRMTLNLAAFYTRWTNQQLTAPDPSNPGDLRQGITLNIGNSRVLGFEAEGRFLVSDAVSIDASLAYIDSQFSKGAFDQSWVVQGLSGDLEGLALPRAPKLQLGLGMQYEGRINADLGYFLRADGSYQSKQYSDTANNVIVDGRELFSARAGLKYRQFALDFWVRNLFDKKYVSAANFIYQTPPSSNLLGAIYGERRTLGVTARARF